MPVTFAGLNERQQAAVEHGQGPLLIVAGAGTGKTRVIVERIGHLLRQVPAVKPSNIVALTFAREAAAEMRQRAVESFGAEAGRCRFSTFHAFCQELLSAETPRRALDKFDQWIFLRRHLEELDLEHYFKVSEPGRFLEDLVDFCSRCHDNLVSPADYSAYIEKLEADCQAGKTDPLNSPDCSEQEILRQKEVARVFALLEQLQDQHGLLTFGAMISRAITLLDSSPALLARLQRRYRYILVDEFQDTNTAQFELLVRLAGQHQNLTVVGDDDQAIYRFRGASYASFEQFARQYPDHIRIVLDQNYRSTQRILAVAGAAIGVNSQDRYLPDKKLRTNNPPGPSVELWEFPDEETQAEYAARVIADQVREGTSSAYSDFAVLYRAHRYRDALVRALQRHRVPFAIRNLAVNSLPVVRDVVAYLRVLGGGRDGVSLARVLMDPRWEMAPATLISYCRQASARRLSLSEILESDALHQQWPRHGDFLEFRGRFRRIAEAQRLAAWFPLLIHELQRPRAPHENLPLNTFQDFLARWEQEKTTTGMLSDFLEYFGYFEEAGGTIALIDEDWTPPPGEPDTQQATFWESCEEERRGKVQLMTIHAAKGLEFEHVIIWHLLRRAFPTAHRKPLIELPPALWKGRLPRGDFHLEEERRLFYVALTRARRSLVLSTISNARQRPSLFVDELQQVSSLDIVRKRPVLAAGAESSGENDRTPAPRSRVAEWAAAPGPPPPGDFTLSISQLETYLVCPLKYHFQRNWQIPVPLTAPLLFGNILHGALKEVVFTAAHHPERLTARSIREILDRRWPRGAFADPVQERKYRQMGMEQLDGLRQVWCGRRMALLYQEMPFEIRLGGCRVAGRVDQIHRNEGGGVELVEYKTGTPQNQKQADRSLQLTLYAKACREVLGLELSALFLYSLTTQEAIRTTRGESQFSELEQRVRETSRNILAGRFSATPGYHCRFCSFRAICPAQEEAGGDASPVSSTIEPGTKMGPESYCLEGSTKRQ